MSKKEHLVS